MAEVAAVAHDACERCISYPAEWEMAVDSENRMQAACPSCFSCGRLAGKHVRNNARSRQPPASRSYNGPGWSNTKSDNSTVRNPVHYTIKPGNPAAHLFEASVTVAAPDPAGQHFMLPVWIPGSYMVREFARNIVTLSASARGKPVKVSKIDKCTWACAPCKGPLTLRYEIYAWDLSVRAAHLDDTHGFFNGSSVFLLPLGWRDNPCEVELIAPAGKPEWKVATALARKPVSTGVSKASASKAAPVLASGPMPFGKFSAAGYDELIDHPVEMGSFTHARFEACGVPHHLVLSGRLPATGTDLPRLCADLQKICEAQIRLFEPETQQAPMREYWFLVTVVAEGFGGLEHRASTALIISRDDLPLKHEAPHGKQDKRLNPAYRRLLSLASHEYFHTWNVKRIKPERFIDYDLANENYTRQLWFFEGFTDYYDDLMLARSGVIGAQEYLDVEAENISRVLAQSGRLKQSVADASFDAWIKYYRQDENTPNALISYYQKGAIIGMALDLTIRQRSRGRHSLDDVMRALWRAHGTRNRGVAEGAIERIAARVTGLDLADFFAHAVHGMGDPDLAPLFKHHGIEMSLRAPGQAKASEPVPATLGVKLGSEANGDAKLLQVFDGGAAQAAGLSAGDTIVAVDGLRINAAGFDKRIRSYPVGSAIELIAFRRDELMRFRVSLQAQAKTFCVLGMQNAPAEAKARRDAWLHLAKASH